MIPTDNALEPKVRTADSFLIQSKKTRIDVPWSEMSLAVLKSTRHLISQERLIAP
jgi:hypothetical protein